MNPVHAATPHGERHLVPSEPSHHEDRVASSFHELLGTSARLLADAKVTDDERISGDPSAHRARKGKTADEPASGRTAPSVTDAADDGRSALDASLLLAGVARTNPPTKSAHGAHEPQPSGHVDGKAKTRTDAASTTPPPLAAPPLLAAASATDPAPPAKAKHQSHGALEATGAPSRAAVALGAPHVTDLDGGKRPLGAAASGPDKSEAAGQRSAPGVRNVDHGSDATTTAPSSSSVDVQRFSPLDASVAAGQSATAGPAGAATQPGHPGPSAPQLPGVASQLLTVLTPMRVTPAGSQTVTVALHPTGLGDVRATMTLTDGSLVVRLSASTPAGAEAIRSALPDLQSGFSSTGQSPTFLLADGGGNSNPGPYQPPAESSAAGWDARPPVSVQALDGAPIRRSADTDALLDVRV